MKTLIPFAILSLLALSGCGSGDPAQKTENAPAPAQDQPASTASGTSSKFTEADLHMPFYPGARVSDDESMVVKTPREHSILAIFYTKDSAAQVKEFYESKVPGLKFNGFNGKDTETMIGESKASDGGKLGITIMQKKDQDTKIAIGYGKY